MALGFFVPGLTVDNDFSGSLIIELCDKLEPLEGCESDQSSAIKTSSTELKIA